MKRLEELLSRVEVTEMIGRSAGQVSFICYDSRKCAQDSMFAALRGTVSDGHDYIETAISRGAKYILCEEIPSAAGQTPDVTFIKTGNTRKALAAVSHAWYDYPAESMKVIGITGTNGKTTTTFLLKALFEAAGEKCGIIGTTGIIYLDKKITATHTTPESLELSSYMAEMRDAGVTCIIMEVSSHALHQHRADFINFDAALFSNLTHEHLDYHKTMEEYARAKKILFNMLPQGAVAIANDYGPYGRYMLKDITAQNRFLLSREDYADFVIGDEKLNVDSSEFVLSYKHPEYGKIERIKMLTPLPGRFNIENAAISSAAALAMGIPSDKVRETLASAQGAPGRMQRLLLKNGAVSIVDYAHTPDALEKALFACREILKASGNEHNRIICVFGCGGDRDSAKRPVMGGLAASMADFTIITNDNPRTEHPDSIFKDILAGIDEKMMRNLQVVPDRAEAISRAADLSGKNDIILVAGKGHEDYQILGTEKHHFDDSEQLRNYA